eukprot:14793534-Ditylum_brightwellii.AAC.1
MALGQLLALAGAASMLCVNGFVPATFGARSINTELAAATVKGDIDTRTGKPTGTSFLPAETVERAKVGNKIEKTKIAKDGSSAWSDIYEYAAKIRAGELDWKDIEGGDFNS